MGFTVPATKGHNKKSPSSGAAGARVVFHMVSSAADVYPAQTRRSILDKHKHFTEQGTFILINRRWLLVCAACSRILSDRLAIYVLIPEKYFAPRSQILSDLLAIYVLIPENTYLKAWPWNLSKVHRSYADLLSRLIIIVVSFINDGICR
ncbi:hypothetical protein CICLE_v10027061mg [Citrus x clementina]|uniref:Uncharacterized protein n=1 Tax=Citrus clementina TaxID=85681 RepID=V4UHU4_CITCL|nr:hypothetical protein CICLE_v10027061mg [Citrus x clementina]